MERVEKIERAISILKMTLTMLKEGKPYKFLTQEPLDYEARCDWVKEKLEKVQQMLLDI